MQRKYKYLRLTKQRVNYFGGFVLGLLVLGAFMMGLVIGFNIRDVMLRTCGLNHARQKYAESVAQQIREGSVKNLISASNSSANITEPKKMLVFKKLPEKYLKNYPPTKPAILFPLEPWKYLERLKPGGKKYFMTFVVKSACMYVQRRFFIRQTWGTIASINQDNFGVIFLVGMTRNRHQQALLEEENEMYGDILQSDVSDNYFHLPKKVLAGFQWINYNLGDLSNFFVTTDDDCVVNIPTVYDYFSAHRITMHDSVHCAYIFDKGHRPIRKERFKWGVSVDVYPGDIYPAFCHGGMTVWPFQILSDVYRTSETTNYSRMHLEDVLISGILRQKFYNSSDNIVARGYQGLRGKYRKPEPFVFHLGLSKDLKRSFKLRWYRCKQGMKMGPDDHMVGKAMSAFYFNATLSPLILLPNSSANKTIEHFVSPWSKYIPKRRPAVAKAENSDQIATELKQNEASLDKREKEINEATDEERPIGNAVLDGNLDIVKNP